MDSAQKIVSPACWQHDSLCMKLKTYLFYTRSAQDYSSRRKPYRMGSVHLLKKRYERISPENQGSFFKSSGCRPWVNIIQIIFSGYVSASRRPNFIKKIQRRTHCLRTCSMFHTKTTAQKQSELKFYYDRPIFFKTKSLKMKSIILKKPT
jgi:hypothetical protein